MEIDHWIADGEYSSSIEKITVYVRTNDDSFKSREAIIEAINFYEETHKDQNRLSVQITNLRSDGNTHKEYFYTNDEIV